MWVDVILKCPNDGEWIALTRVNEDGNTESAGYITEHDLRAIAPILKAHIAYVEEHGGDGDQFQAAQNLLHHIEVVL